MLTWRWLGKADAEDECGVLRMKALILVQRDELDMTYGLCVKRWLM